MEFSTIGAEDSLDEAKKRLNDVEILVVLSQENIIGVLTSEHLVHWSMWFSVRVRRFSGRRSYQGRYLETKICYCH